MNELYFLGMDIVEELKNMTNFTIATCTDGMTENEFRAYEAGVKNTISALKALLDDDLAVINVNNIEIPTELTIEELEEYYSNI
jgi:hypothetical protein